MSSGAEDTVRAVDSEPVRLQHRAAEFFQAGPEGSLGCTRVISRAGATHASACKDIPRPGCAFVALCATDTMAIQHSKPRGLQDATAQLFDAGPKLSLAGQRMS